jgi:hypothetical protein
MVTLELRPVAKQRQSGRNRDKARRACDQKPSQHEMIRMSHGSSPRSDLRNESMWDRPLSPQPLLNRLGSADERAEQSVRIVPLAEEKEDAGF